MADEMNGIVSHPGASPWIVTTPGPGLIRHNIKSQKRSQLLQEASTLTPDQQELVKQLTDRTLSPADANFFGAQLNEGLRHFSTRYNENPFYAFSREGKETVSALQRLVRDPRMIAAERAFKTSEEEYKKLKEQGLENLFSVRDGRMDVISKEDGEIVSISPDSFDASKYMPVTMGELYNYQTGTRGFYNPDHEKIKPFAYAMEDPAKVIDEVNKWFTGLGTTTSEEFNELVSKKDTSNFSQIRSRLNALYDKTGLPQTFRDTMYSQYYTEALKRGEKPTREGAEKALVNNLVKISEGYNVFKTDLGASPNLDVRAKASAAGLGEVSRFEFGASNKADLSQFWQFDNPGIGRSFNEPYAPIDKVLLQQSTNKYRDDSNIEQPKMNVKNMRLFNVVTPENIFIPNLKNAGELAPLPKELYPFLGEIMVTDDVLGGMFTKIGDNNQRFITSREDVQAKGIERAFLTKAKFQGGARGEQYDAAQAALIELGYDTRPAKSGEMKLYKNNIDSPDYGGESWYNPTNNDMFDLNLVTIYKDPKLFNDLDKLPMGLEPKANQVMPYPPSDATQQTGDEIQKNPFGNAKGFFSSFSSLSSR